MLNNKLKQYFILFILSIILFFSACSVNNNENNNLEISNSNIKTPNLTNSINSTNSNTSQNSDTLNFEYKNIELLDITTNQNYFLNDFQNIPILVESFAVWCPTCTKQQQIIKQLHNNFNKSQLISISLNTDPNEDEIKIKNHIEKHNFNWHYSISPQTLTNYFIDEFGLEFVSAPQVPVVLICPNSKPKFLKSGIKDIEYLTNEINNCNIK